MSTHNPETLRAAEDAVAILSGLARALEDPQVSPTGMQYAEQVSAAAGAIDRLLAIDREQAPDPVWAGIAAVEHLREICFHLTRP